MIAFPSLRYFVSFMKNSPKKNRNNHPGYSGIELRKLIKEYPREYLENNIPTLQIHTHL